MVIYFHHNDDEKSALELQSEKRKEKITKKTK